MFFIKSVSGDKYGVIDTKDGVVEYYSAEDLEQISSRGIDIKGYFGRNCIAPVSCTKALKLIYRGEKLDEPYYDKIITINSGAVNLATSNFVNVELGRSRRSLGVSGMSFVIMLGDEDKPKVREIVPVDIVMNSVKCYVKSGKRFNSTSVEFEADVKDLDNIRYQPFKDYILADVVCTAGGIRFKFFTSLSGLCDAALDSPHTKFLTLTFDELLEKKDLYSSQIIINDDTVIARTLKGVFKFSIKAYRNIYKTYMTQDCKKDAVRSKLAGKEYSTVLENGDVVKLVPKNGVFDIPATALKLKEGCMKLSEDCKSYGIFLPKNIKSCSTACVDLKNFYSLKPEFYVDSDNMNVKVLINLFKSLMVYSFSYPIKINCNSLNRHNLLIAYLAAHSTLNVRRDCSYIEIFTTSNFMGTDDTFDNYVCNLSLMEVANLYRGTVKYLLDDFKFMQSDIDFIPGKTYRVESPKGVFLSGYDLDEFRYLLGYTNWCKYETGILLLNKLNSILQNNYSDEEYVTTAQQDCYGYVQKLLLALNNIVTALATPSHHTGFRVVIDSNGDWDLSMLSRIISTRAWTAHYESIKQ